MAVTILQITDTHIHDLDISDFYDIRPSQTLKQVIRHALANTPNIDYVVVTGDLSHDGGEASAHRLREQLQQFDCPIFVTPGNHDDGRVIKHYLQDDQISVPDRIELEHWQLLFLDSHIEGQVQGEIKKDDLENACQQLEQCRKPALLFTHHPPIAINCHWLDKIGMNNGDRLLNRLSKYLHLKTILFGHIHQSFSQQWEHFLLLGCPSTCVQFKPGSDHFATEDLAPGYRLLNLDPGGQINTQIRRIDD